MSTQKTVKKEIHFYTEDGKWGFLSPMYPCSFSIKGINYRSSEHYYQSMKATDEKDRAHIRDAPDGYEAKKRAHALQEGKSIKNGEVEKVAVIHTAFFEKFAQNPELRKKLIDTREAILCEDSPDDLFWGYKGKNMIGVTLMNVRDELKVTSES